MFFPMKLTPGRALAFAIAGLVLAHALVWARYHRLHLSDPDTYTYLSLAREVSQRGLVTSLPQVKGLHWDEKFTDKNLAFNTVNGALYRLAGERGVAAAHFLVSLGVMLAVFFGARHFVAPSMALLLTGTLYFNAWFVIRLMLLRPHVWAMASFCLLAVGLLRRSPKLALAGALLFGWGYPVYLLPAALIASAAAVFLVRGHDERMKRACVAAAAGLVASIILHPGYPGNVAWSGKISQIAVNDAGLGAEDLPTENIPQRSDTFAKRFGFFLLAIVLLLAGEALTRAPWPDSGRRREMIFLLLAASGLWGAAFVQPRASEYAMPMTMLLVALGMSRLAPRIGPRYAGAALAVLATVANGHSLLDFYAKGGRFALNPAVPLAVMDAIPRGEGSKVFNCEWETGAFLLYRRPDLEFIDLLDPTFLPQANPSLSLQRQLLFAGRLTPWEVIREGYGADYVVCRNPTLVGRLDVDPLFTRLYPPPHVPVDTSTPGLSAVYRVDQSALPRFVRKFDLDVGPGLRSVASPASEPLSSTGPYLHLVPLAKSNGAECFDVTPSPDELKRLSGARWLSIGGGPYIEVTWNRRPLYRGRDFDGGADYVREWIPLPRELSARDKLSFRICSGDRDEYHGAAFGLWRQSDFEDACRRKGQSAPTPSWWTYERAPQLTCLGPVASAPAGPR